MNENLVWNDSYEEFCSFYETWSSPYLLKPGASSGFYELRLMTPKKDDPDGRTYPRGVEYFPQTEQGRDECFDWIQENRDKFDILSSVLPRQSKSWNAGASPLVGNLWCDIDAGHCGGPDAAIDFIADRLTTPMKIGQSEFLLPQPHIIVSGRNGIHLYWLLDDVYRIGSPSSEEMLKSLLKRLFAFVSGPPFESADGSKSWPTPFADSNLSYPTATLRPPTSFNHKEDNEHEVKLIRASPGLPRHSIRQWSSEIIPPQDIPDAGIHFSNRDHSSVSKLKPGEKRKIPSRTQAFIANSGWAQEYHNDLVRAVSDMAWSGYGQDETYEYLLKSAKTSNQRAQVKEVVRWFARTKPDWKE
jgi:hypothetical protein